MTNYIHRYNAQYIPKMVKAVQNFVNEKHNGHQNHYKGIDIDTKKLYAYLSSKINDTDFFCDIITNDDDEVLGGLCAVLVTPIYSSNKIAYDQIFYIHPKQANVKAIIRLLKRYTAWAKANGAFECRLCTTTGYKQEAFTKLCKRFKFQQIGTDYARRF